MSGYGGTGSATLLRDNQQVFLFQKENNIVGKASAAYQLERINRSYYPWGVAFQVAFTDVNGNPADPGSFQIDIQASDIDQDSQYCPLNSWSSGSLNPSFVARIELQNFYAKYIRAKVTSLGNAVYTTLLVTH